MGRPERDCLLVLAHARFLRAPERIALAGMLGGTERLAGLTTGDLARLLGRAVRTGGWDPAGLLTAAERTTRLIDRGQFFCTCWGDPQYPALLAEIHDPPAVLFHRGAAPDPVPAAGRRRGHSPADGRRPGCGLPSRLRAGPGIDRRGLGPRPGRGPRSARGLLAPGGYSIGVLGCGPDLVVPAASRGAARRLLEAGGMLLCEYPPGTLPRPWHFPRAQPHHQRPVPLGGRRRGARGIGRAATPRTSPSSRGATCTCTRTGSPARPVRARAAWPRPAPTVIRSAAGILADWGWQARCGRHGRMARRGRAAGAEGAARPVRARRLRARRPKRARRSRASRAEIDGSDDVQLDEPYGGG